MTAITREKIFNKNVFTDPEKEVEELNKALDITEQRLKDVATASVEAFKGIKVESAKDLKKFNTAINQSKKAVGDLNVFQKERLKLLDKLSVANATRTKENTKLKIQIQEQNKANKQLAREELGLVNAHDKLTKATNKAQKEFKNLAVEFGLNSKQAERARQRFQKLDDRLRKVNETARDGRRDVGRYGTAWQKVGGILSKGLGVLGITAGIFALTRVVGNAIDRIRGFDKVMRNIAGITGIAREELASVENEIKKVARESIKTSNEVGQLAETLFTLGKTKNEVEILLKPVNDLSIALEATSDEAGELLIQTLNAFGKSSDSAQEFADIIAKIRTSTALDFTRIKDALGFLAPTAKAAGVSFEETGAILGVLVDNGIKAARAGRLTSTSFLKLAADGKTLNDALDEINKAQDEGVEKTDLLRLAGNLFGKESAALGLILADNRDRVAELTEEFKNSQGTLDQLTGEQLKSLDARLKILDSAWESFILTLEDGQGGFASILKTIIDVTAELLGFLSGTQKATEELNEAGLRIRNIAKSIIFLTKVLGSVLAAFVAYRLTIIATNIATKAYTVVTNGLRIAQAALSGGLKGATKAMKGFNLATKANPIGALIALLTLAVTAFLAFRDSANEAADAQRDLNNAMEENIKFQKSIEKRLGILDTLNKTALTTLLADIESSKERLKIDEKLTEQLIRQSDIRAFLAEGVREDNEFLVAGLKEELRLIDETIDALNKESDAIEANKKLVQDRIDFLNKETKATGGVTTATNSLIEKQLELLKKAKELSERTEKDIALKNDTIAGIEKEIKRLRELTLVKKDQLIIDKEIAEARAKADEEIQAQIDAEQEILDAIAEARATANQEILDEQKQLDEERLEAQRQFVNDTVNLTKQELVKKDKLRLQAADDDIARREDLIEQLRESNETSSLKSLAFEEAQLEKARLARQREEEKQQRRTEAILLAETFLRQLANSDKEGAAAIAEAFSTTFLAKAIAAGLSGFKEGIDDTGTGVGLRDKDGAITGYTHEREMVFNEDQADQMRSMGYTKRDDIVDAVREHNAGNTWMFMPKLQGHLAEKEVDMTEVVESHKTIVKAIEDNRVQIDTHWDSFHEVWEKRMKGMQKETIKFIMKKIGKY